jgi:hypothetical protein
LEGGEGKVRVVLFRVQKARASRVCWCGVIGKENSKRETTEGTCAPSEAEAGPRRLRRFNGANSTHDTQHAVGLWVTDTRYLPVRSCSQ